MKLIRNIQKITIISIVLLIFIYTIPQAYSDQNLLTSDSGIVSNVYSPNTAAQGQTINVFIVLQGKPKIEKVNGILTFPQAKEVFKYEGSADNDYSYKEENGKGTITLDKNDIENKRKNYFVFKGIKVEKNPDTVEKTYELHVDFTYQITNQNYTIEQTKEIKITRGPPSNLSSNKILLISLPLIGIVISIILFAWLYSLEESKF